uniref:C2H2-type domain-containing protein n=1 Tax=Sphaeramia orbicularis TaxID=375764 RepID=A0A673BE34_9TELE
TISDLDDKMSYVKVSQMFSLQMKSHLHPSNQTLSRSLQTLTMMTSRTAVPTAASTSPTSPRLERHVRQHHTDKPGGFVCSLCEGEFTGMPALQRHQCPALTKTLVCSICPQTFECRQSLADHENQHSGEKDFICETCGESFFSSASLSTHRVTHTQTETCCDVLGLGCSDMSVLRNHLSQHSGQKLFTCDVCGKGCSHRSALKHHMLTHTGERPYVCETCGKRCGHASALQNHMRVHTGRKPGQRPVLRRLRENVPMRSEPEVSHERPHGGAPYACEVCGKKFANPSNLKAHTVTHSGKKMHGCTVCGRRFTQSSSLKTHRRIHTGEKPYRCAVCGKAFVQRCEFTKHQHGHVPMEEDGGKQSAPQWSSVRLYTMLQKVTFWSYF